MRMRLQWPALESRLIGDTLVTRGWVRATSIATPYEIELRYRVGSPPRVRVLQPKLARRPETPDDAIPHLSYAGSSAETPCLYYPDAKEWTPAVSIAKSIMPWLLCWLSDYEMWYTLGVWHGGGIAPPGVAPAASLERTDE